MKITTNVIVGEKNPEPYAYFALASMAQVVDEYVVVNTGSDKNVNMESIYRFAKVSLVPVKIYHFPFTNFADVRNVALMQTNTEWIWRLDCDEVHYKGAEVVRRLVDQQGLIGIRVYFYHFMLDYDHVESIYPKVDLLRIDKSSRYMGNVHEQFYSDYWFRCQKCRKEEVKGYSITTSPYEMKCDCGGVMEQGVLGTMDNKWRSGIILDSGYKFAHYSYVRPQKETYVKWEQYAQLEGKPDANKQLMSECGGEDKILEHRREKREKFKDEHPEVIKEYIYKLKKEGKDKF